MTEEEWLTATDPAPLLKFLGDEMSDRELRLFSCSCVRRANERLPAAQRLGDTSLLVVDTAERYADGQIDARELKEAHDAAYQTSGRLQFLASRALEETRGKLRHFVKAMFLQSGVAEAVAMLAGEALHIYPYPWSIDCGGGPLDGADILQQLEAYDRVFRDCGDLLRDIVGNPFRPVAADPAWLTPTVVALAEGVYAERAFDRLPVLADALEEAGCDDPAVLAHCRGEGPHARGCWVVDLVLGKS